MSLSDSDKERIALAVRRMVADYRLKPTQEKEDALGVELARMAPAERDYAGAVLMTMVREDARRR